MARVVGSEVSAAGDDLGLTIYTATTQDMRTTAVYSPAKTKVVVRYLGPN